MNFLLYTNVITEHSKTYEGTPEDRNVCKYHWRKHISRINYIHMEVRFGYSKKIG